MNSIKSQLIVGVISTFCIFVSAHTSAQGHHHASNPVNRSIDKKQDSCQSNFLECAKAATPYFTANGQLYLVWSAQGNVFIAKSTDLGKSFDSPKKLAEHGKTLDTGSDARPQILVDQQKILVAYAFFKDTQWNAQVNLIRSEDGGESFSTPLPLIQNDSSQRFPILGQSPQGEVWIIWVDKRLIQESKKRGNPMLGGSIAYAWSSDFGKTFIEEQIANKHTCECCRIGMAFNSEGLPFIVYRAILNGGIRDHVTQEIGKKRIGPVRRIALDDWKTDACPHHGPAITVSDKNDIHVAWFTQGSQRQGVFYAQSKDHGALYSQAKVIGSEGAIISRPYLLSNEQDIWMVWKEFNGKETRIMAQYSVTEGLEWSTSQVISKTAGYSDHPLLIKGQGKVFLSWLTRLDGYQFIALKK